AIDPEGKMAGISSTDIDSYLGIVKLEEEAFNLVQDGQKSQEGALGQGQQEGQNEEGEKEKKEIKITSVDFFQGKTINIITLSPDGKTILAEIKDRKGKSEIRAYNSEDGSSINLDIVKQFNGEVFSLTS
ncbi:MAG: hypothetical protein N2486_10880, partial [Caloramator sp.]|nr:hypothetical protein [Caloramator sp.]